MRKLSLVLLIMTLLAGVSVNAQKKKQPIPAPVPLTPQTIIIQDGAGEGFMFFDLGTGAYKCKLCEYGYTYSGIGSVKRDGCLVTFSAIGDGYTMTAYASLCEQQAKCIIQVTKANGFDIEPWEEVLSDPDTRDSQATCTSITPPPPAALPSEVILQNDLDFFAVPPLSVGSFLCLVPATGEFKFVHCADNTAMGGVGQVTVSGPWLNFEVITNEYRIMASVNLDAKTGKAAIDIFVPIGDMTPMHEVILDSNFSDNVPVCGAKK
ncbi:MAG TPA: hypothetical protein VNO24_20975 [Blastocatellia bacterium]|nr:hypothetical protein [Blastocatellia bacterium]